MYTEAHLVKLKGNRISDLSSNTGRRCLLFTLRL